MKNRLLARLSAVCVLSLIVAAMSVLSSLTVNAQRGGFTAPPLSAAERKAVGDRARQVFRNEIVHGENREADDNDLKRWLGKYANGKSYLEYDTLKPLIEKLGNGFGAQEPGPLGVPFVLPNANGLGEVYIFAVEGSEIEEINDVLEAHGRSPINDQISVGSYELPLRRRMDSDASGKISEDEFADYVVVYFDYKAAILRRRR